MSQATIQVGDAASRSLLEGVAATLRRLEREAAGLPDGGISSTGAARRLHTFQRSLARSLQAAHLETVQELAAG